MDALAAYPAVNSLFDVEAGTHTFHGSVNLGVAVDLNKRGLLVANVRDADATSPISLARAIQSVSMNVAIAGLVQKT